MKNIKTIMLIALASIILAGCGGKTKTDELSPSKIAEKVLAASQELDFETLKQYLAQGRLDRLDESEKNFSEDSESRDRFLAMVKGAKVKVLSETISEDKQSATVTVQIKLASEEETFEKDLDFINENGKWKIDSNPY
jgi:hypothetical protein